MKKIKEYKVTICDDSGIIKDKTEFVINEYNVLGENSINIVIDDPYFTTIRLKSQTYCTCIDKHYIGIYTNDNCWGNRINYLLYTYDNVKPSIIRKQIEKEISKKFGFFIKGFDLSFIK